VGFYRKDSTRSTNTKNISSSTFYRLGGDNFVSALTGQRVEKILELVKKAADAHKRRVSTAVINEVLEEAVSRHSPQPLAKDVREKFTGTKL